MAKPIIYFFRALIRILDTVSNRFIQILELEVLRIQGKGYGADTPKIEVRALKQFIGHDDVMKITFFDVGAHIGEYTEEILRLFPNSQVHCFEPNSISFNSLASKFALDGRVQLNKFALGEDNATSSLYYDKKGSPLSSLLKRNLDFTKLKMNYSENVIVKTLNSYCQENSVSPTVLKLDVEGFEMSVLKGAAEELETIRIIQFEFGGANKDSKTYFLDFWSFFTTNKFEVYRISPRGPRLLKDYSELDEHFRTTNFFAVNSRFARDDQFNR